MMESVIILICAFVLDYVFGDPDYLPHPVIWMGNAISTFENRFRNLLQNKILAGLLFALTLILITWLAGFILVKSAGLIGPKTEIAVNIILLFYCISSKSLKDAALEVKKALDGDNLIRARRRLSFIVGRETQTLDSTQISRASIETVAENLVDGFISPVFFALMGGAPLALAYKMVNTLDSMVGYKNAQYLEFGKASARIDDLFNYIPSKISVFIISIASFICFKTWKNALITGISQGHKHTSPNAGYSEAAFSGALEVRLAGPSRYHGNVVEKPFIGEEYRDATAGDIDKSVRLMMVSSAVTIPFLWLLFGLTGMLF